MATPARARPVEQRTSVDGDIGSAFMARIRRLTDLRFSGVARDTEW